VRVLYVNHTAEVSGAERSLLDLIGAVGDEVTPLVACPQGPLQTAVAKLGLPCATIAGTAGSLRLHPLHTPRTLGELALAAVQVQRLARGFDAELLHANSIRAGIVLGLAGPGRRRATVVHVRDCLPPSPLATATMRLIAATATTIVANSRYTAASLLGAAPHAHIEVVHNPVDIRRWDPTLIDRAQARDRVPGANGRLLLGVVAQLSPWKGQDTAIAALQALSENRFGQVRRQRDALRQRALRR